MKSTDLATRTHIDKLSLSLHTTGYDIAIAVTEERFGDAINHVEYAKYMVSAIEYQLTAVEKVVREEHSNVQRKSSGDYISEHNKKAVSK